MLHPGRAEINCPDCKVSSYNSPFRLECGHHLCQVCIERTIEQGRDKCPTCKAPIEINAIDDSHKLSRALANLEEEHQQEILAMSEEEKIFNTLLNDAQSCFERRQYNESLRKLNAITMNLNQNQKLKLSILKAKCMLRIGNLNNAKAVCADISSIIDSKRNAVQLRIISHECDQKLIELIEILIEKMNFDFALKFVNYCFKIVISSCNGELKLSKLEGIGFWMKNLASAMSGQRRIRQIRSDVLPLMDDILKEMQETRTNDLRRHFEYVVWFIRYFGRCSNMAGDYDKSVTIYEGAKMFMTMSFQGEASKFKVFSFIHNNLGLALKNKGMLVEAYNMFSKAIQISRNVKDWISEEEQARMMMIFTCNRRRIRQKQK